jgi:hypothetical protein
MFGAAGCGKFEFATVSNIYLMHINTDLFRIDRYFDRRIGKQDRVR